MTSNASTSNVKVCIYCKHTASKLSTLLHEVHGNIRQKDNEATAIRSSTSILVLFQLKYNIMIVFTVYDDLAESNSWTHLDVTCSRKAQDIIKVKNSDWQVVRE